MAGTARDRDDEGSAAVSGRPRRLRRDFESLLESVDEAVLVLDSSGRLIYLNQRASRFHELASAQPLGRGVEDWPEFDYEDLEGNPVPLSDLPAARALEGAEIRGAILVLTRHSDGWRGVREYSAVPLFDGSGQVEYVVVTSCDRADLDTWLTERTDLAARLSTLATNSADYRDRLSRELEYTRFLRDVAQTASEGLDAARIASNILETAEHRLGVLDGAVYTNGHDGLHLLASRSPTGDAETAFPELMGREAAPLQWDGSARSEHAGARPASRDFGRAREGCIRLVAPLRRNFATTGALLVDAPGDADIEALSLVLTSAAESLSVAIENCRLYAEQVRLTRRARELEKLEKRMLAADDVEQVLSAAIEALAREFSPATVIAYRRGEGKWIPARWSATEFEASAEAMLPETAEHPAEGVVKRRIGHTTVLHSFTTVGDTPWCLSCAAPGLTDEDVDFFRRACEAFRLALGGVVLRDDQSRLLEARADWIADVSHDIRTPLSAISGYAKLLASDYETPPEEVRRQAGHILEQASAIGRLISDLRFAFEVDVKSVAPRIEPTDVASVVHQALAALRLDARFSRTQVVVRRSRRVPLAKADPALLGRVLTNVLVNSAVHNDPGVEIEVSLKGGDDTVDIVVNDRGNGMDDEALARLFERRFSGATARGDRGMGLGLPIARRLVEAMNGTIEVESTIGRGTQVTIRLPRHAEATNRAARGAS